MFTLKLSSLNKGDISELDEPGAGETEAPAFLIFDRLRRRGRERVVGGMMEGRCWGSRVLGESGVGTSQAPNLNIHVTLKVRDGEGVDREEYTERVPKSRQERERFKGW